MYKNISPDVVTKLGKFVFLYESEKLCSNKDKETKSLIPRIVNAFNLMINPHFHSGTLSLKKGNCKPTNCMLPQESEVLLFLILFSIT